MTRAIHVDVETAYVREQSDPAEGRYVFAYTVTIRNDGGSAARLMRRHWIITDGNGDEASHVQRTRVTRATLRPGAAWLPTPMPPTGGSPT